MNELELKQILEDITNQDTDFKVRKIIENICQLVGFELKDFCRARKKPAIYYRYSLIYLLRKRGYAYQYIGKLVSGQMGFSPFNHATVWTAYSESEYLVDTDPCFMDYFRPVEKIFKLYFEG